MTPARVSRRFLILAITSARLACLTAMAFAPMSAPAVASKGPVSDGMATTQPLITALGSASATTPPTETRSAAVGSYDIMGEPSHARTRAFAGRLATKAGPKADEAFHYTRGRFVESIKKEGLRPGSYATSRGDLSPLQAQIDLALPPNRGLSDAVLRVDLAGLRKAGYDTGEFTQVGRKFNMPGGGTELQFKRAIPPQFLKVVDR